MKKLILCVMICLFGVGFSLAQTLTSPDGNLVMDFHLSADKTPVYSLKYKGKDSNKRKQDGLSDTSIVRFQQKFPYCRNKRGCFRYDLESCSGGRIVLFVIIIRNCLLPWSKKVQDGC